MDFTAFNAQVKQNFSLELNSYKEKLLKRRIDNLIQWEKRKDYADYLDLLLSSKDAYERFVNTLTINVTEFFRNIEVFAYLENKILPLFIKNNTLKIWSAGCANGAEPYSVAILLEEKTPRCSYQIEATDIDENSLEAAVRARYGFECLRNVSKSRLDRFFQKDGDYYLLKNQIKQMVTFKKHDLLKDVSSSQYYNLIICRNVFIYLNTQAQNQLYAKFYHSLAPEGILFTGSSEIILNCAEKGFERISPCFYKKLNRRLSNP